MLKVRRMQDRPQAIRADQDTIPRSQWQGKQMILSRERDVSSLSLLLSPVTLRAVVSTVMSILCEETPTFQNISDLVQSML